MHALRRGRVQQHLTDSEASTPGQNVDSTINDSRPNNNAPEREMRKGLLVHARAGPPFLRARQTVHTESKREHYAYCRSWL